MKRIALLKNLLKFLKDNDAIIISGAGLTNEVSVDERIMCFDRMDMALSFSVGLSMVTDKRVFVICEDIDLLKNYSILFQISASKCQNIFVLVLGCDRYQDSGGQSFILSGVRSIMGASFNIGLISHNFTKLFDGTSGDVVIADVFDRLRGPMCVFFNIDPGVSKRKNSILDKSAMRYRFSNFVQNLELGTSVFVL